MLRSLSASIPLTQSRSVFYHGRHRPTKESTTVRAQDWNQVLTEARRICHPAFRCGDPLGRGISPFCRATPTGKPTLANRILDRSGQGLSGEGAKANLRITCSISWAVFRGGNGAEVVAHEQVLVSSDYALYQAGSGRNRALPAGETPVRGGTVAPPSSMESPHLVTPGPHIEGVCPPRRNHNSLQLRPTPPPPADCVTRWWIQVSTGFPCTPCTLCPLVMFFSTLQPTQPQAPAPESYAESPQLSQQLLVADPVDVKIAYPASAEYPTLAQH